MCVFSFVRRCNFPVWSFKQSCIGYRFGAVPQSGDDYDLLRVYQELCDAIGRSPCAKVCESAWVVAGHIRGMLAIPDSNLE